VFGYSGSYALERYMPDLVDTGNHRKPRVSTMVWAMVWLRDEEGGALKLVFCEGDSEFPRGGVTSKAYCDVLEEGLLPLHQAGDPCKLSSKLCLIYGSTDHLDELHEYGITSHIYNYTYSRSASSQDDAYWSAHDR
jgi:hypothetical protein